MMTLVTTGTMSVNSLVMNEQGVRETVLTTIDVRSVILAGTNTPMLRMDVETMTYLVNALELMMSIESLMHIPNGKDPWELALKCKQLAAACRMILEGDKKFYQDVAFVVLEKWDQYGIGIVCPDLVPPPPPSSSTC